MVLARLEPSCITHFFPPTRPSWLIRHVHGISFQLVSESGVLPLLLRTLDSSASAIGSNASATAVTTEPATSASRIPPLPLGREMASEIIWVRAFKVEL